MSRRYPAKLVRIIDGDSFVLDLDLGFHITKRVTARLAGADTPELRSRIADNRKAARLAKAYAAEFMADGDFTYESHLWQGKYGRAVGDIRKDGGFLLSSALITRHLAIPYGGGRRGADKHADNIAVLRSEGRL